MAGADRMTIEQVVGKFEALHADQNPAFAGNGSVAVLSPKVADRLYAPGHERERATETEMALSAATDQEPASPASPT